MPYRVNTSGSINWMSLVTHSNDTHVSDHRTCRKLVSTHSPTRRKRPKRLTNITGAHWLQANLIVSGGRLRLYVQRFRGGRLVYVRVTLPPSTIQGICVAHGQGPV